MLFKKLIYDLECVPKGYGLAYKDIYRRCGHYYPIPLNLIIRAWDNFYCAIAYPQNGTRREIIERKAYLKGLADGKDRALAELVEEMRKLNA